MFCAGKIGLGVAIDYALGWSLEAIWTRVRELGDLLRGSLSNLGFITVHDLGAVRCGIVTFTAQGVDSDEVKRILSENRINVSVSPEEISRLDLSERNLPHVVRASVHYYNTEEEIEEFCNRLKSLYGGGDNERFGPPSRADLASIRLTSQSARIASDMSARAALAQSVFR